MHKGPANVRWKGGRTIASSGYVMVLRPGHPRGNRDGYVREHILVVEAALGHPLRASAEVHHINGVRSDNRSTNLIACDSHAYHKLLHQRQAALAACGNANWLKCAICKQYDSPDNLYIGKRNARGCRAMCHRACHAAYQLQRYHAKKLRTQFLEQRDTQEEIA